MVDASVQRTSQPEAREARGALPDEGASGSTAAGCPQPESRPEPPAPREVRPTVSLRSIAVPARLPEETLALHAAALARFLASRRRPDRWCLAGFARDVARFRRQLAPIRSSEMLAASYSRESRHLLGIRPGDAGSLRPALAGSALEVAYAIRWLELVDGEGRPDWLEWQGVAEARTGD